MKRLPPWWVAFPVALVVWLLGVGILLALRGEGPSAQVYVVLTRIPYTPARPTATPSPTPTATPTPTPVPEYVARGFRPGAVVQVANTDGARLRIREAPGLESAVRFLAYEGEVFRIVEGPVEKDGYRWWYIMAPYSTQRAGWAAEPFLQVVE